MRKQRLYSLIRSSILREWFYIARELQKVISTNQISKELGRDYKHVHRAVEKIMKSVFMRRFLQELSGKVEIDEMYHSTGQKGEKCSSRPPRKRGLKLRGRGTWNKDKAPIIALFERKGRAIIEVAKRVTKKVVKGLMKFIDDDSKVYTDDFTPYQWLSGEYEHEVVNHSKKEYVKDDAHVNSVEGLFSLLRHWLNTFRGVCKKNLKYYVAMFEFVFNLRWLCPFGRFDMLLERMIPNQLFKG